MVTGQRASPAFSFPESPSSLLKSLLIITPKRRLCGDDRWLCELVPADTHCDCGVTSEIAITLQLLLAAVPESLSTKRTGNKFFPLQLLHCSWEWCSGRVLVPLCPTASGGGQAALPLQGFSKHVFWSARVAQTYLQAQFYRGAVLPTSNTWSFTNL